METSHCLKSKPVPTYTSRVFFAPLGSKKGCRDSLTGSAFPKKNGIALKKTDRDDNVESEFSSARDRIFVVGCGTQQMLWHIGLVEGGQVYSTTRHMV